MFATLQNNLVRLFYRNNQDLIKNINLKKGTVVILEGGGLSFKDEDIKLISDKIKQIHKVIEIDCMLPLSQWLKDEPCHIVTSHYNERIEAISRTVPKKFFLVAKNLDNLTPQKLEYLMLFWNKQPHSIVASCSFFNGIPNPLKPFCTDCQLFNLGHQGFVLDVTLVGLGLWIMYCIVSGFFEGIYVAASLKFLLRGLKFGRFKL